MTYDSDTEAAVERTPILGGSASNIKPYTKKPKSYFSSFMSFFGGGIYAPDTSTYEPIEILLNTEDEEERDRLTENWRDNRLAELSFVGVVAALLAGVLTSTGSWPDILPEDEQKPWPVRTAWYCGIVLALFSILTAADQTVRLHRISAHRDGLENLRKLLSKKGNKPKSSRSKHQIRPNTLQIYTWQLPVLFLTAATIAMIAGMFLHVWAATRHLPGHDWWDSNSKMAVTFTIVAVTSIVVFFAGQATLSSTEKNDHDETP